MDDDYILANIEKAHAGFVESPANRPSMYGVKRRSMMNSARYSKSRDFEHSPVVKGSKMLDANENYDQVQSDDMHPSARSGGSQDRPQEMKNQDIKRFNQYLRDNGQLNLLKSLTGHTSSQIKIKKNKPNTKNLSSLGNILKKSLDDPLTDGNTIPDIKHELLSIRKIDRLFKPRKNKNWYFLKYMPLPQRTIAPIASTIEQSKKFDEEQKE